MLEELQRRNYAATTITSYIQEVEQFARYFRRYPTAESEPPAHVPGVSAARAEVGSRGP